MALHRAGPGETVRTAAAWSALALVAWQAWASVCEVRVELGRPFERHVRVLRASAEELVREKLGAEDYEILAALRRLPPGTKVRVSFLDERSGWRELRRRITWLASLVYPVVLVGWPFDPARAGAAAGGAVRRETVLDLQSGRDFSAWPSEELARGARFRLLLVGSG
jgi:hypothetical protein